MKLKICLVTIATSISFLASAAELSIDKQISPMAINGVELEERVIELPQGTHQFVGRYSYQLKQGGKNKRFQSQPMVFTFAVNADDQLELKAPRFPRFDRAEYAFNNNEVEWELIDERGSSVELNVIELPSPSGLFPFKDIEQVMENYNDENRLIVTSSGIIAADRAQAILVDETTQNKVSDQSNANLTSTDTVGQLKAWYLQASKQERKTFRKWMIDQD